jgi:uncharacterized protein
MQSRILNGWFAIAALLSLGACSTPCGAPGGLCAPTQANTSVKPIIPDPMTFSPPPAPQPMVNTMPILAPDAPAAVPPTNAIRIGLILPLRSDGLRKPASALRDGFLAAYERDRAGFVVNIIETGDSTDETLDAYMAAVRANDLIVGPLARPAVAAVAISGTVSKPTIALNHPDGNRSDSPIPPKMLVVGLSIEDEARQVAAWAAAEHPRSTAMIVTGNSPWQRRMASAFGARWTQLGNQSQVMEMPVSSGYVHEASINQLKSRLEAEPPALVFAALDGNQLRQVRSSIGALPVYGTSSVNPGTEPGSALAELDGVRLLDVPWAVQPDHSAVMVYPRPLADDGSPDLDRLYALGIDAFRIAREIALKPSGSFKMDGVTGRLTFSFGQGPSRFSRSIPGAVYQGGAFKLVQKR